MWSVDGKEYLNMRRTVLLALLAGLAFVFVASDANAEGGKMRLSHFFNFEWFRDADGDGIPNCLDDDWAPPQDGSGYQDKHGFGQSSAGTNAGSGSGQGISQKKFRRGPEEGSGSGDRTRIRQRLSDGSCQ
jgi:hypothetical protein